MDPSTPDIPDDYFTSKYSAAPTAAPAPVANAPGTDTENPPDNYFDKYNDSKGGSHPVTDEVEDLGRHAIRGAIKGVGDLADTAGNIWDTAFHPDSRSPTNVLQKDGSYKQEAGSPDDAGMHPMAHMVAEKLADRLQQSVPSLAPKYQGNLGKDVESGFEALPMSAVSGPETAIPTMLSGAASQEAANQGAGPVGQAIAGALPLAPAGIGNAARRVIRGSVDNIPQMNANAEMFEKAGIQPDLRQLKATPVQKGTGPTEYTPNGGNLSSGALPGGQPLNNVRNAQPNAAQNTIENLAQAQAPNVPLRGLKAGAAGDAIDDGVKADRARMSSEESVAFHNVETLVGKDKPAPATNFIAAAQKVNHPTGIPEVDSFITGPQAKASQAAADALKTPAPVNPFNPTWNSIQSQPTPVAPSTYGDLRVMRSKIGNTIDWGLNPQNPGPNGELKQLYGALGKDLNSAIDSSVPLARTAADQANAMYASNAKKRELLDTVVDKVGGPGQVFNAAVSANKNDAYKIGTVLDAMNPEQQGVLRGAITNRLGHPGGNLDKPWDENTHLNNYQAIDSDVKDKVFGTRGQPDRDKMDAVEGVLQLRKNLGYNTNRFSMGVQQGVTGALTHAAAVGGTLVGEHLLNHMEMAIPTAAAGVVTGGWNAALARISTNPKMLNTLRQAAKAPKAMAPILMSQLARMGSAGQDVQNMINSDQSETK